MKLPRIYRHPKLYDLVDDLFSLGASRRARKATLELSSHGKILEVGVGTGKSLSLLDAEYIVGIDLSLPMLLEGKADRPRTTFIQANAYTLPFRSDAFSVVVFSFTLSVLKWPARAIDEAARVGQEIVVLEYARPLRVPGYLWRNVERWGRLLYGSRPVNISRILRDEWWRHTETISGGLFQVSRMQKLS